MLLGTKTEIIDTDNLRNALSRLSIKVDKLVEDDNARVSTPQSAIKGYLTEDKLEKFFNDRAEEDNRAGLYTDFAGLLSIFLEPYGRTEDPIDNINQALRDIIEWSIAENYTPERMGKIIDICAKTYEHKKSSLTDEAEMTSRSLKFIQGLLDVFELRTQITGATKDKNIATKAFSNFMQQVRAIVAEPVQEQTVIPFTGARKASPT